MTKPEATKPQTKPLYKIEGEKLVRLAKYCPRCGAGVFMAEHIDRFHCGRCSYTEFKPGVPKFRAKPSPKPIVEKPKEVKKPKEEEAVVEEKPVRGKFAVKGKEAAKGKEEAPKGKEEPKGKGPAKTLPKAEEKKEAPKGKGKK